MSMVAALFVETNGAYFGLPDVAPWDIRRDARLYKGPYPVVCHSPCSRWCQLAYMNQKRYGHKVGADGGMFAHALTSVRAYGGVLEHPANSYAWPAFQLQRPQRQSWQRTMCGAWVTEISQVAYGHRAIKKTWLYAVVENPPLMDWSEPAPTAQVSFCKNHGNSPLPRLSKKEAKATPIRLREILISIARSAHQQRVAA